MSEDLSTEPDDWEHAPDGSITDLRGQPAHVVVATPPPTGDVVAVLDDILSRFIPVIGAVTNEPRGYALTHPYTVTTEDFDTWCALRDQIKEAQRLWLPPPPGDTREQLPKHLLALMPSLSYLSTACELARICELTAARHREHEEELMHWSTWLHQRRCRSNNKFSGKLCVCECHKEEEAQES